jgi:hypothetical protein
MRQILNLKVSPLPLAEAALVSHLRRLASVQNYSQPLRLG